MGRSARWLVVVAVTACANDDVFVCASDQQCGADGRCESTGFCSFPDAACASGRRYGDLSGSLAGECVGEEPSTDGTSTTSASTSTTDFTSAGSSESTGPPISASGGTTGDPSTSSSSSSTSTSGPPIERVVDGLVVLYTFDEGVGDLVEDVSGVDPPINLTIMGEGYEWMDAGLAKSNEDGILLAEGSATKVLQACQATNAITLEAWVTPAEDLPLPGPARVITYSLDTQNRNFTFGQTDTLDDSTMGVQGWIVRLRASMTDLNGAPELIHQTEVALTTTHLAFVHDAEGNEILYIDAIEVATGSRLGTFDTWDPDTETFHLAIGNELTLNRSWNGVFHLAAIYDRALDALEVQQNFDAGY